jgi:hypothetical protein
MTSPHERRSGEIGMKSIVFVLWILSAGFFSFSLNESVLFPSVPEALSASTPSLITTEQEVREFFDQYVQRYNRMDLDGFLKLFSSRAKQNQQDGPSEIRTIYSDFFNRTTSLQSSMEEMKIEIYQNAAEVRARYVVTQVLKKDGEKRILKGSGRWVLIKENGTLKILSIDYRHDRTLEGKQKAE